MTVNEKWQEVVVAYFRILLQHLVYYWVI